MNRTHDESNGTLYLRWLDTAALAVGEKRVGIIIQPAGTRWAQNHFDFPDIISAGPLLVWNSRIVRQRAHTWNETRYSRTDIGLTKDHHLLLLAVDGNAKESAGVTIPEFAALFKALKSVSALNSERASCLHEPRLKNFQKDLKFCRNSYIKISSY
ncbi:MAG: phosphodiester glycosidase family protein [Ginsengibacter sp.]